MNPLVRRLRAALSKIRHYATHRVDGEPPEAALGKIMAHCDLIERLEKDALEEAERNP